MIAYRDVKSSPSGWPEEEDMPNANEPVQDFEYALSGMIASYRNKFPRQRVIEALNAQAGLLVGDAGWDKDGTEPKPDPTPPEEDDPTADKTSA